MTSTPVLFVTHTEGPASLWDRRTWLSEWVEFYVAPGPAGHIHRSFRRIRTSLQSNHLHGYWQLKINPEKKIHQKHKINKPALGKKNTKHPKLNEIISPQYTCNKRSYVCVYNCVQLWYTIQHWTVLIIFPLILQTIMAAQMMSTGVEGNYIPTSHEDMPQRWGTSWTTVTLFLGLGTYQQNTK